MVRYIVIVAMVFASAVCRAGDSVLPDYQALPLASERECLSVDIDLMLADACKALKDFRKTNLEDKAFDWVAIIDPLELLLAKYPELEKTNDLYLLFSDYAWYLHFAGQKGGSRLYLKSLPVNIAINSRFSYMLNINLQAMRAWAGIETVSNSQLEAMAEEIKQVLKLEDNGKLLGKFGVIAYNLSAVSIRENAPSVAIDLSETCVRAFISSGNHQALALCFMHVFDAEAVPRALKAELASRISVLSCHGEDANLCNAYAPMLRHFL